MTKPAKNTICLWYDGGAEEAARFYAATFPDSFCMLEDFGGCCLYDESSRTPGCSFGILGWLIAAALGRQAALLPRAESRVSRSRAPGGGR